MPLTSAAARPSPGRSLTALLLAALCALGWAGVWTGAAKAGSAPPNIVLIVTDDQRWDTLGYMPTVQAELVRKGVTFENAFVTNPRCCPSRASILTGAYSHTTRVYQNAGRLGGFRAFRDESTIATWLDAAGYETALVGKYLNLYPGSYVPPGWDRWVAFLSLLGVTDRATEGFHTYGFDVDGQATPVAPQELYSTDFLAGEAVSFIRSARRPFFLFFAPFAPHTPALPAARHADALQGLPPWRPPNYNEADVSDKPAWQRSLPPLGAAAGRALDDHRAQQLRSLLAVDDAVGDILRALAESGQLENTLIVFTSDNGYAWGEHRWAAKKRLPYEETIRVPLVVRYDALRGIPRRDPSLLLNIDLAPTFADFAATAAPGAEGKSFRPLIAGEPVAWRPSFLVEHAYANPPSYCALRTRRHTFVVYATGELELYDLVRDPYQLSNLAGDPASAPLVSRLRPALSRVCNPPPPRVSRRLLCTHSGTPRGDVLRGTRRYDVLCGGGGADRIRPGKGDDWVFAGAGADRINVAGGGSDVVSCGPGLDLVRADGSDRLRGCERSVVVARARAPARVTGGPTRR